MTAASKTKLLAAVVAGGFAATGAVAQVSIQTAAAGAMDHAQHAAPLQTLAMAAPSSAKASRQLSANEWRTRNNLYYKRNWGLEVVGVKPVSSGYMLSFRYRIHDPEKAKVLNDRKARAYIIDEATGTRLAVPAMEKIGELRTGATPETDRTYFMMFGNPGKLVKSGSKVSIVVGNLKVDGLTVD